MTDRSRLIHNLINSGDPTLKEAGEDYQKVRLESLKRYGEICTLKDDVARLTAALEEIIDVSSNPYEQDQANIARRALGIKDEG